MVESALQLSGLVKRFGQHAAVAGVDLAVAPGEFVTLLGPSGCGKTTTLNLIAGFLTPDEGHITLAGKQVESLPPFKRDLGLVFQDYALFPHMSVADNVAFGLKMRGVASGEIATRVREALSLVQLDGYEARKPLQLSGGQRQRVALARALVIRPAMLLLDEPLSNLDLKLREEMRIEISAVQRRLGIATVFVTHDQGEALTMSDRIAVMRAGKDRAAWRAIRDLRAPGDALRRGLHRLDQHGRRAPRRRAGQRRLRAPRDAGRSGTRASPRHRAGRRRRDAHGATRALAAGRAARWRQCLAGDTGAHRLSRRAPRATPQARRRHARHGRGRQ